MRAPLNLSRQPFRNERLPTLLLSLGTFLLVVVSVRHTMVAWQLLPGHSRDVSTELASLEGEAQQLGAEAASLREATASPDAIAEWATVKRLVDRRAFSWTGLFAALEGALPPGVRLVSVSPSDAPSGRELSLSAQGRANDDALLLLQSLQAHSDFEGAFLDGWSEGRDGVDISCTVNYVPKSEGKR